MATMAAQRAGAQSDDWAHVILEYSRLRVILHASMLVAAPLPRFIVHGHAGSWIKYGLDAQEGQLIAALTPDAAGQVQDAEHAALVDGGSGTELDTPVPRGDYRQFYVRLRDALQGAGSNPVPAAQALPVMAVVEVAVRSSAEGRALPLTLTEREIWEFER
jgi:predicted dehydrogenase